MLTTFYQVVFNIRCSKEVVSLLLDFKNFEEKKEKGGQKVSYIPLNENKIARSIFITASQNQLLNSCLLGHHN